MITDLGELRCSEFLVVLNAGFEREVEDTAGHQKSFDRLRRLAGFKHHFDVFDKTAVVVMGSPVLQVHER